MGEIPVHFTHLRTHSHFTLLGATLSLQDLVDRAAADGFRSLALTDTNALYGAIAFARACGASNIAPIIGLTVAVEIPAGEMYPDAHGLWGNLTLLAHNAEGYRSLCNLSSLLQTRDNAETREARRLTWDDLKQFRTGLVCLTGDRTGWLERFTRAGNQLAATRYLARLGGLYGDRCYVAIRPGLLTDGATGLGLELINLGRRFGISSAAVQPVYCRRPDELALLRVMAAIRNNCRHDAVEPGMLPAFGDEDIAISWPDREALGAAYAKHDELLATTVAIAEVCTREPVLPTKRHVWRIQDASQSAAEARFRREAAEGLAQFFGDDSAPEIVARLNHEIEVILLAGYADLFLVVADIVRYARSRGIAVSTRGSVANSLVAFCLGISTVDPIAHELLFERFMNPARSNPPDIDLDFCSRRRDEVLNYVRETYGEDHVALVSTMSTLQLRSAVRETAKAYGLASPEISGLVARLPRGWHPDPRRRSSQTLNDILPNVAGEVEVAVIKTAIELVGRPHHASIHPGGLVITPEPLTQTLPVELAPKGFLITQYAHDDIEAIGLPKIDLLGIRALTVLTDTVELVKAARNPAFRLEDIPVDDAATGDLLAAAETIGVFQCESEGARRTLRQLRARTVTDLAVASAFFKPGPATGGMAKAFVRRYRGEEPVTYLHSALEPLLGGTMGVLLFQEQVLRVVREIAGLSWEQADHIRRGMSKFKAREMETLSAEFVQGCCRQPPRGPGLSEEQAQRLWEQVVAFAGYGFNQGHATAYADVSYRSAYLKAHWPAEFLCARLAGSGGFHHQAVYIAEARRLGIPVRPPHVNVSGNRFTLSYETDDEFAQARHPVLWMGLGQVRGLQRTTIRAIVRAREQELFTSLADLLQRVELQAKETEALIQCGALDGLGGSRQALLEEAKLVGRAGAVGQLAFSFAAPAVQKVERAGQRLAWEKHILGLPVSATPLDLVPPTRNAVTLRRLDAQGGALTEVNAFRLPGWTGGKGYFIADGDSYVSARLPADIGQSVRLRPVWEPMRLAGRWRMDEWGNGWFQIEQVEAL